MRNYIFPIFVAATVGVELAWILMTGITFGYRSLTGNLVMSYQLPLIKNQTNQAPSPVIPLISARAYLLADLETGKILVSREPEVNYPIASLTKLMTALIALEAMTSTNLVSVNAVALAAPGDAGGLVIGETLSVADLLYPLLLQSSNDAAETIAGNYDREQFIRLMNEKAKALGRRRTFFADPSGIDEGNRSTARDLFRLADYLYRRQPSLLALTQISQKRLANHLWLNNNHLVGAAGYLGGKTGQTTAAHETLVALFDLPLSDGSFHPVVLILLQSNNRDADARALLDYLQTLFNNQP